MAKATTMPEAKAKRAVTRRRRSFTLSIGRPSSRWRVFCVVLRNSHSNAEAQTRKNKDEQQDGPPTWDLCLEEAEAALELVGQVGERAGHRHHVLAGRADSGIEVMRHRFIQLVERRLGSGFG